MKNKTENNKRTKQTNRLRHRHSIVVMGGKGGGNEGGGEGHTFGDRRRRLWMVSDATYR